MSNHSEPALVDRRIVLEAAAGLSVAGLAGCTASGDGTDATSVEFDGWFDDVSNYDGVADETGADAVEVTVGAPGNEGHFAFAPAAVSVSRGTTVRWTWTGKGSMHNVVADDDSFESETLQSEGETFEREFDRKGVYRYYCRPHERMGMKGAVVVE
ncbi:halocyanin domain-containing protein [Halorussus marinus]|uniref:halocyanin domain-containing protein n=1 Tax=Halorussus marinus TaxID=2505976 RepID=UPI001091C3DB|nr:halocyanin domain-containing protein [Halorussus marinus]